MTSSAAPQRHIHRSSTGRLTFAHAPRPSSIKDKERVNTQRSCDFKDCGRARHALHRFCVDHYRRYERTGHPDGQNIRRGGWGPYVAEASAFVTEQLRAGHPGIEAAAYWCLEQLRAGGAFQRHDNNRRQHVGYLVALGRCHRNGVEPTELLARHIAAYSADDREEAVRPLFRSDDHWRHQAAMVFLYARPIGQLPRWARRNAQPSVARETFWMPRFGVREYTYRRVSESIGLLAFKAAAEMKRREAQAQGRNPHNERAAPVEGSSVPFANLDQLFTFNTTTSSTKDKAP